MTNPFRLLVVDDSSVSRTVLMRGLGAEIKGAEVSACASAAEAQAACASTNFDGIVVMLPLPDMEGAEFVRACRKRPRHRYTALVVVSGDAGAPLRAAVFDAGVTQCLDKGQGYPALVAAIAETMRHHFGLTGRVLYVEDSPTSAKVTTDVLEKYGLQVVHTPDAEQALELLHAAAAPGGEPFDLVLTDYLLPGNMTGADITRAIRADLHYSPQALPVLVITGQNNTQALSEVLTLGSNDWVTKPIVAESFMARVRNLLLIRQQHQALQRTRAQASAT